MAVDAGFVEGILAKELNALKERIIKNHTTAGQRASGKTIASMSVNLEPMHATLVGRQAFGTLETGRKGGKVPARFADIIAQWIVDKGIAITPIPYIRRSGGKYSPEERGLKRMSFLIARKIRQEGTALYRQGGRADIFSNEIPTTISNIRKQLTEAFTTEIHTINLHLKDK